MVDSVSIESAFMEVIKEAGLSQASLDGKLRCHRSLTARIRNGERLFQVVELVALARAIGAEPAQFVTVLLGGHTTRCTPLIPQAGGGRLRFQKSEIAHPIGLLGPVVRLVVGAAADFALVLISVHRSQVHVG